MTTFLLRFIACIRLTDLVVDDEVTRPAREWVGKRWPGGRLSFLLSCKRCTSVWAAAVVAVLPRRACTVLALSQATIWVNDAVDQRAADALTRRMTGGPVRREGETSEV
jgi:hypothetical protein